MAKLTKIAVVRNCIFTKDTYIYINNNRSLDFADQMNLWLSYKLYGVQNQAASQLQVLLGKQMIKLRLGRPGMSGGRRRFPTTCAISC